ncbi:hypothetical protein AAC387_Pa04g2936 [Persea americana]
MARILGFLILASLFSTGTSNYQGDALFALKNSLKDSQLSDWYVNQVNPCQWKGVECDADSHVIRLSLASMGFSGILAPEIGILKTLTHIELQGNNITGKIPEQLGNLTNLEVLMMENNSLTGEIPTSFGNLTKLQILSLSQNNLSGNVPDSISYLPNLHEIQLAYNGLSGLVPDRLFQVRKYNFTGNNLNCGTNFTHTCVYSASEPVIVHKSRKPVVLGSVGGGIGFLLVGGLVFLLRKRMYKDQPEAFVDIAGEDVHIISFGQLKRFSWLELQVATDHFNEENVLGQGGFGKVYKGVLSDNTAIAVKRITDNESPGGEATFVREVEMISVAVHKNLLRLIGFCTTQSERLLVYPFMKNRSVASRLRDIKLGEPVLDWKTRKRVALGTALGLEYLHEHCSPKIIHRDVKAANVLLDENFEAVVGDFGLAKLVDVKRSNVTTLVRGTMGHIAPEYLSTGKSSEKTDIFGYGITILELVTGKRAIEFSLLEEEDDVLLLDHVKRLEREKRLDAVIDRKLNQAYDFNEVEMMIRIALLCTQASPDNRPMMSEVVRMIEGEGLTERWQEWKLHEAIRKQEETQLHRGLNWYEGSVHNQEAVELSGAR